MHSGAEGSRGSCPPELGSTIVSRVDDLDWDAVAADLDAYGAAATGALLSRSECRDLSALYDDEHWFRSRITMASHGFGRGEYQYFAYPLPALVADSNGSHPGVLR
jgi:uncharacterized protein